MTNPRLSSHFLARPISCRTSRGSLLSRSVSEKGCCLPPPHLGAFVARLSAFLVDAGVTGCRSHIAFGEAELSPRQFASADFADFRFHIC